MPVVSVVVEQMQFFTVTRHIGGSFSQAVLGSEAGLTHDVVGDHSINAKKGGATARA